MQRCIFGVAIIGATSCLVVYVALSLTPIILAFRKARAEAKHADNKAGANETLIDPVPFVDAIAKLVDSLAKAGPVLQALIGSMLFLLIAAFAAGLFGSV